MKPEYQAEGSVELAKDLRWWTGLRLSKTNSPGMLALSRHYAHRLCWDWSLWFGFPRYWPWRKGFGFSKHKFANETGWSLALLWCFRADYTRQGYSWMLSPTGERQWNRYLDTPAPQDRSKQI